MNVLTSLIRLKEKELSELDKQRDVLDTLVEQQKQELSTKLESG